MDVKVEKELIDIVGIPYVLNAKKAVDRYLYDATLPYFRPEAAEDCIVVSPANTKEIAAIMKYANRNKIPVVARGGGTGLCGAVIPTRTGIIISMERLKRIIEVDENNFIVTAESGVTLRELNAYLSSSSDRIYFASHSCDENAQIGGMVAENAGGLKFGKYGVTRSNVRGLEVVLASGEIIQLNGKLQKNNAGYDLMQLMIGSEGTLGVITKVMLHVLPRLRFDAIILVSFGSYSQATDAATKVLRSGVSPMGIEYLDRTIATKSAKYQNEKWPMKKGNADLMFVMCEENEDAIFNVCGMVEEICSEAGAVESLVIDGRQEQERLLNIRKGTYHATKGQLVETMDIAVAPADTPRMMEEFNQLAEKYGVTFDTVGHIGEGNVHNNIYVKNKIVPENYEKMRAELYRKAIEMGGTITGEHGIGKIRRNSLSMQLNDTQIALMQGIKNTFDPNHILNPDTAII